MRYTVRGLQDICPQRWTPRKRGFDLVGLRLDNVQDTAKPSSLQLPHRIHVNFLIAQLAKFRRRVLPGPSLKASRQLECMQNTTSVSLFLLAINDATNDARTVLENLCLILGYGYLQFFFPWVLKHCQFMLCRLLVPSIPHTRSKSGRAYLNKDNNFVSRSRWFFLDGKY